MFWEWKSTPNHEYFMMDNVMDQRVKSVLKLVRTEVSLHFNGANLISTVTLPHRPTGSSFIQDHFVPCIEAAAASAGAVVDLS